jgi:hypothetical protein
MSLSARRIVNCLLIVLGMMSGRSAYADDPQGQPKTPRVIDLREAAIFYSESGGGCAAGIGDPREPPSRRCAYELCAPGTTLCYREYRNCPPDTREADSGRGGPSRTISPDAAE